MSRMCGQEFQRSQEEEKILEGFGDVIQLFEKDCEGRLYESYINLGRLFLKGYGQESDCELMLRLWKHVGCLVIARIEFIHQRQGNMTELVRLLTAYGKKNGYRKIIVEAAHSESIQGFLKKHSFLPVEGTLGNWEMEI